ncbi:cobyric acid synthase [Pseudoramibacter sp.]|uniref:cobyric acid synthase n=1 Tax=Pseudoramibacter sp. TaxID=2034862 RepID=UPI0025CEE628|nr:cobyric acid synthase [Pseudoramibacter sp.]MCH4072217.1 cobyric acid synthase [Pseudoramibacter sp.]MCH4105987.1 cobyric acid synthase [Pseudoramibacter sp.]
MGKKVKKIMFQGTGSSVGKSLMCAAMCRIFSDMGMTVRPFKAQNMALNSFITKDGKEMGRAQVTQAECARIEPDVRMNPVLLKPNSDIGSQVILNGVAEFNMDAADYHRYKSQLTDVVLDAYNSLAEEADVVVIEGAGSPAEINLRENDIVNMGLAEMIDAPVVLIGDIDRGGVFASVYGTVKLLPPEEQARFAGYIINKFRGDVALLKPGIDMMAPMLHVPCLGVVPYTRVVIDDEDSVTERWYGKHNGQITIGIVRLRHVSNFTDATVFDMYPEVSVEYYKNEREIERAEPDLLIIPGSKNTIDDVKHLKMSKMADAIIKKHDEGVPVVGICGGYQIIGKTISDPYHVESQADQIEGLGLLDIDTELEETKTTTQETGTMLNGFLDIDPKNKKVRGYEIHMGKSEPRNAETKPFARLADGRLDGAVSADKTVVGTYLHGIFDNDELRESLLNQIKAKKHMAAGSVRDYQAFKESQYNLLAKTVKEALDMDQIMAILDGSWRD